MAETYTQAQLTALRTALASGVLIVEYDGKRVQYRSVSELQEAIRTVAAAIAQDAGGRPYKTFRFQTGKGYR
jgi:hypothetical protein